MWNASTVFEAWFARKVITMLIRCSIGGCKQTGVRLFGFHKDNTEIYKDWLICLRISRDKTFIPIKADRLCSEHFIETDCEESDLNLFKCNLRSQGKIRLKSNAVPRT